MKFMTSDIVIGIDSSTTGTKAIAWDVSGNNIAEGNCQIPLVSPQSGYYEQNPADWWNSAATALMKLTRQVDKERVKAVSIANQRETFVTLNKRGEPLRPAIIWLDERCKDQVDRFAAIIGEDKIHQITGKPKDFAPVVYRLAWMKEYENELFRKVFKFCDVQSYLVHRLTGHYKTSWSSADPLGIFDLENKIWSIEILKELEITTDQLPETFSPGTILGQVGKNAAEATGLRSGTPVVAGGGDGQSAGLGVNALLMERAYLNLGTAVVSGMFIKEYVTDRSFRTMASCSGSGYYGETSLRAGTFLIDWFFKQVLKINSAQAPVMYKNLEEEARQVTEGSEGVLVLPYWNAVMNPYWDPDARGCIIGLNSGHHRGHLYRAILEGIAMEQSLATEAAERAAGRNIFEYALIGGGAKSKLWRQIIADVCNKRILKMDSEEATSLGAGISAAMAAGWFNSFEEAAKSMTRVKGITEPIPQNVRQYQDLKGIYRNIYPITRGLNKEINALKLTGKK
jgi:sugar (pentulose or hexulose) kinase